ncbi:MAG: class I SAM-dependent methyltransferase [Anaerolineales bacterium]|nr:class I SAM-dependent methyltransferase [Anaerolineales bacterium]
MSLSDKLMKQGGKPSGSLGRLIGYLMNLSHKNIYHWGLKNISFGNNSKALDIGCGGGEVIKLLATKMPEGKVYGIDHSPEMVNLSKRVNKSLLENNRVEINHGSVSSLPYQDNMFEIVTAFETIQFWNDLNNDLKEVKRVLKASGMLLIVNRYPDLQGKDAGWAEVLQIHSSEEYQEQLSAVGFVDISIDEKSNPGWILVLSRKP